MNVQFFKDGLSVSTANFGPLDLVKFMYEPFTIGLFYNSANGDFFYLEFEFEVRRGHYRDKHSGNNTQRMQSGIQRKRKIFVSNQLCLIKFYNTQSDW